MAFYIMLDNPEMGIMDAIRESKRITNGYKMDIFILYLLKSFIGWALLATIDIWYWISLANPYIQTTFANLYNKLKSNLLLLEWTT